MSTRQSGQGSNCCEVLIHKTLPGKLFIFWVTRTEGGCPSCVIIKNAIMKSTITVIEIMTPTLKGQEWVISTGQGNAWFPFTINTLEPGLVQKCEECGFEQR